MLLILPVWLQSNYTKNTMADTVPYGKRYYYPHMKPYDIAIWERFIEQFPDAYDNVQYGVRVGTVPEFVTGHEDPAMQKQAEIYQREIDVVGLKSDQIDIIELKPNASTSALGQVNGYRHLYMVAFTPPETPKAIVITDRLLPDMNFLAEQTGVQMIVV